MGAWLKSLFARRIRPSVSVGDDALVFRDANGEVRLSWADLTRVAIETTDEGPFVGDFFWLLDGGGTILRIASSDPGAEDLLIALQELPGFDNAAVSDASMTVTNATFECWVRRPQTARQPENT